MQKIYVLDTNILLTEPSSMVEGFDDNIVVITDTTLQELDAKKTAPGETGANAREACRILDEMREQGDLITGTPNKNGGLLRIQINGASSDNLPHDFSIDKADNRIIAACISIADKSDKPVILVTNDALMRVAATVCAKHKNVNLDIQSYRNTEVETSYAGYSEIEVAGDLINALYQDKQVAIPEGSKFYENEFVTLHAGSQSGMTIARNGMLSLVKEQTLYGGIRPMNQLQTYAMHALEAPPEEIPLVCLLGPAGTAKTFLSLAAGLTDTYASAVGADSRYYKMLVSRPNNMTSDPGIGYLPGDMNEKMEPLLSPLYDNMESILLDKGNVDRRHIQAHVNDIFESIIEITALSYIRGRTLRNTYLFVDEAQNASRSLVKDIISRAGYGTKVVLCGDPDQVDSPHLDSKNNGLVYAVSKMKSSPLCAIVRFDASKSVRSPLAKDAIQRL